MRQHITQEYRVDITSHVARWVPKLKDGIMFGMEHPDIVELEEERWVLQESSLQVIVA